MAANMRLCMFHELKLALHYQHQASDAHPNSKNVFAAQVFAEEEEPHANQQKRSHRICDRRHQTDLPSHAIRQEYAELDSDDGDTYCEATPIQIFERRSHW